QPHPHSFPTRRPSDLGHTAAPLAHRAAFAAQQQGKFWEMHDRIFANQREMEREALLAHASALGLDVARFTADLDSPRAQAVKRADRKSTRLNSSHVAN